MDSSFRFAQVTTMREESTYPYNGYENYCYEGQYAPTNITVKTYSDVTIDSPTQLKAAVFQQPVSAAIDADSQVFQFYESGIITSLDCGVYLDHGVLVIGYGTDTNKQTNFTIDYWLVKNSWGSFWGDKGYVKIERNSGQPRGMCGILSAPPSYPTMA